MQFQRPSERLTSWLNRHQEFLLEDLRSRSFGCKGELEVIDDAEQLGAGRKGPSDRQGIRGDPGRGTQDPRVPSCFMPHRNQSSFREQRSSVLECPNGLATYQQGPIIKYPKRYHEEICYSGYECYRYDSLLEEDKVYSKVLLVHPEWRYEFGLILGIFKIKNLPEIAIFKTKAGLLKEEKESDCVEFKVSGQSYPSFYAAKQCYYDGNFDNLAINLDRYASQDIELVLQVME